MLHCRFARLLKARLLPAKATFPITTPESLLNAFPNGAEPTCKADDLEVTAGQAGKLLSAADFYDNIMDIIKAIKTRRSIRQFTATPVADEILRDLVDCGRMAPSGHNKQARCFLVLTDREKINGVGKITTWGNFIIDNAQACIIVVCDKEKSATLLEDGCAAAENILLAATAYGLASCWVDGYGMPYSEELEEYLHVPQNANLIAIVALGYPTDKTPLPSEHAKLDVYPNLAHF